MAEALVSIALEKLNQVVGQQLSLFADATSELQELSYTFESIQAVLADAESRQVEEKAVHLWLSRLRHAAYDMQDLLEEGQISGPGDEEGNDDDGNCRKKARLLFGFTYNPFDYALSHRQVANNIKEIKKRLDQIDVERNRFGFSNNTQGGDDRRPVGSQLPTTSLMDKLEMFIGRENDNKTIIGKLVSGSSRGDRWPVQVVAVVGIGGLGKTALARQIYHDRWVRGHFNTALYWVCVSEVFDVIRLTEAILRQVKLTVDFPSKPDRLQNELLEALRGKPSDLDTMQKELLEALRGKRFLLVLDDVWNDDAEKWKTLRLPLIYGANDSRILVTTRSQNVANAMNAAFIHELKGLSDHDSWELFKSRAFAGKEADEVLEFENVGKKFMNKCKGVPLSIKVIGSAMHSKRTINDWEKILESKTWSLPQVTDKILPPLLLTYCNLPTHLKPCFVYCSMFPKDWEFEKDILVRLWVAQGFIQLEGNREIEDIGEEYFDDLVARSMFQQVEKFGKIKYTMYVQLHDLAECIAKDEIYCSEVGKSEESFSSNNNVRHAFLSFIGSYDKYSNSPIASSRAKKLRTLWLDETVGGGINSVVDDLFHQARFLRALYLYFPLSTRLQKSIGNLKHLRYLHLPQSEITELRNAIGRMKQLRALQLPNSKIVKLPNAIGKLEQLRYLDLSYNSNLVELPESMSDLRNLHRLNLSECTKLKKLPRGIGGMVNLRYLDLSQNSDLVELPESVSDLHNLHTLNLSECRKLEKLPRDIGRILSLRYLDLSQNSNIVELPESVSDLRNLHTLNLSDCRKLEKLPRVIGRMVNLRYLNLSQNSNLVELPESVSDLRNLHTLNLNNCCQLEKLPRGIDGMVSLRHLQIAGTDKLKYMPKGLGRISGLRSLCKFIVGGGDEGEGCGIDELQPLNSLQGSLEIEHLERVSSPKEAEKAQLWRKQQLCRLAFWMSVGRHDDVETERIGSVLEHLLPPDLEELKITWFTGPKLPSWMDVMQGLRKLVLYFGPILDRVPYLPHLEEFQILSLRNEILPNEGWEQRLVALQKLDINFCKELKCLPEGLTQLSSLENLHISFCDKLGLLPEGLGQLKKLKTLRFEYSNALRCVPNSVGQLESLESLYISSCKKLESLPVSLGQLKKLKKLTIQFLDALRCVPDWVGQLESLESLNISSCKKLESLPGSLGQLKKLKRLYVGGSEVWKCLPDSVGQLESLDGLCIRSCKKLKFMPDSLGQLKALSRLDIWDCEALASLPQGLRFLSHLRIEGCPLLLDRYKREGGVDWPNISHIPNIYIN